MKNRINRKIDKIRKQIQINRANIEGKNRSL